MSTSAVIDSIPSEDLDRVLTDMELASVARHLLNWQVKAMDLGLSATDIEDIRANHTNNNQVQKAMMMRKWKDIYGDRATLRNLLGIAERKRWYMRLSLEELGYRDNTSESIAS